jgi:hypothetical protein
LEDPPEPSSANQHFGRAHWSAHEPLGIITGCFNRSSFRRSFLQSESQVFRRGWRDSMHEFIAF